MKVTILIIFVAIAISSAAAFPEHLFSNSKRDSTASTEGSDVKHWALLVAGSNGWFNYRHQADICHAYQVLHSHGIPDEQIIVMMYDDIANNSENPNKGVIINHPDGPNVYPGVPKDYTKEDVTPDNFLALLQGGKPVTCNSCSGKVLKSDANDHLFVYFADHGGTDLIAFPDGELHSQKLLDALTKMHTEGMYGELVFYLEACESGSMFINLPKNIDVYATTAANPDESSWGTYCDNPLNNCLGDEYSVNWMEDSDLENLSAETLKKQYKIVVKATNKSHPQEYGNMTMAEEKLDQYQSGTDQRRMTGPLKHSKSPLSEFNHVPSREVEMTMLHRRLLATTTPVNRDAELEKIIKLAQTQRDIIATVTQIVKTVTLDTDMAARHLQRPAELRVSDPVCYENTVKRFSANCYRLGQNDYAMGLVYVFANMCNQKIPQEKILEAIQNVC